MTPPVQPVSLNTAPLRRITHREVLASRVRLIPLSANRRIGAQPRAYAVVDELDYERVSALKWQLLAEKDGRMYARAAAPAPRASRPRRGLSHQA